MCTTGKSRWNICNTDGNQHLNKSWPGSGQCPWCAESHNRLFYTVGTGNVDPGCPSFRLGDY